MDKYQLPKFKLQNNVLGRKISLVAILHNLKPYIYSRYVAHFSRIRLDVQQENYELLMRGAMPVEYHTESNDNQADNTMQSSKIIWQGRLKQKSKNRLFSTEDIIETVPIVSPIGLNEICNEVQQQLKLGTEQNSKLAHPIIQYIINELKQLHFRYLINPTRDHLIHIECKIPSAKFVVASNRSNRIDQRIEIEINQTTNSNTFDFSSPQLYLNENHNDNNLNPKIELTNHYFTINNDQTGNKVLSSLEAYSKYNQNIPMAINQAFRSWYPKKLIRIVLTYFFVFFVISFLYILIP